MALKKEDYIKAIESVFLGILKKSIINFLVRKLPFLALPALNPVLGYIVGKLLEVGMKEAELRTYFLYTDFRTNLQANKFSELALEWDKQRTPESEKKMLDAFYTLTTLGK